MLAVLLRKGLYMRWTYNLIQIVRQKASVSWKATTCLKVSVDTFFLSVAFGLYDAFIQTYTVEFWLVMTAGRILS